MRYFKIDVNLKKKDTKDERKENISVSRLAYHLPIYAVKSSGIQIKISQQPRLV